MESKLIQGKQKHKVNELVWIFCLNKEKLDLQLCVVMKKKH